jgi:hypothetical protein
MFINKKQSMKYGGMMMDNRKKKIKKIKNKIKIKIK